MAIVRHRLRRLLVLCLLGATSPALATAQTPVPAPTPAAAPGPARVRQLARDGRADAAWAELAKLPATPDTLRLGIEIAVSLKDLKRGIEYYDRLAAAAAGPDRAALTTLALAVAADLIAGRDPDPGVTACSAALRLDPTHAPCRQALDRMTARTANPGDQATAFYALADAGIRPDPSIFTTLERTLSPAARLQMAVRFKHLPIEERFGLASPSLESKDPSARYQATLVIGDLPARNAMTAINAVDDTGAPGLRQAKTVALAQLGHRQSLELVASMIDSLDNYIKAPAAYALARSGDARGSGVLEMLTRSPVDLQRVYAADYVARINKAAAHEAILKDVASGSPVLRPLAIEVAGRAGLGTDRTIYSRLDDSDPSVRAGVVGAIADTFMPSPPPAPVTPTAPITLPTSPAAPSTR